MKKWLWLLLVVFGLSRLYHILLVPPFMDELLYVRWLGEIRSTGDWLVPLKEFGWEPLGIWLASSLNILIPDPLLALRLTSVLISGAVLVLLILFIHPVAGAMYLLSPIILVHDRLGLRGDNLVILAALLVYLGLKKRLVAKKSKAVLWVGLGIALGLFAKTTAAALPIVTLLAYLWYRPKLKQMDFLAACLAAIPVLFYVLTNTLGLVINKQVIFVGEAMYQNNLLQIGPWSWQYLTWPVILLAACGLIINRKNYLLLFSWLVPLVLLIATAKILFPRYLLPIIPFWLVYAGLGWVWLEQQLPRALKLLLVVFLLSPIWFDVRILKDFSTAPLPEIDRWQYVTGWPSGYGLKELVDYLRFNPTETLIVEGNDLVRTGINYYWPGNNINMIQMPTDGVMLVTNVTDKLPEGLSGALIKDFPRPENKSSIRLWQLE